MNETGTIFRVGLFGESHGPAVGVLIDGIPPGLPLSVEDLRAELDRRRPGAEGTTARREADEPQILSGLYRGRCTGTPLCITFHNMDARPSDYGSFAAMPRPGHADFTGGVRYRGYADPRGSGHFSGRLTVGLVAAGTVAKKILAGASFSSRVTEAGGSTDVGAAVAAALAEGDSVGGMVEIRVDGLPAGLGEPFFGAVESRVAQAVFAVPGVRGVEFGDGFAAARMRGSEHNDPFTGPGGQTGRNGAGGVNGGVTNGNALVVRVALKPPSTISRGQETYNRETGRVETLSCAGRHDACIAPRAAVALDRKSVV